MAVDVLSLLWIFSARVFGMSCNVARILAFVKGRRFMASCLGFFEAMIYVLVLGSIFGGGKSMTLPELISCCAGFATGNYVGAWLEERLLKSFVLVEAIIDDNPSGKAAIDALRATGAGATVINGMGLNGPKLVVKIFCSRRDTATVQNFFAGCGFVTVSDVKRCIGGCFP